MVYKIKYSTKYGFSLIECLVYLLCSSLFITLVCSTFNKLHQYNSYAHRLVDEYIALSLASDALSKDIYKSSMPINIVNKDHIVFNNNFIKNCGWKLSNNRLMRYERLYNKNKHKWSKKVTSVVAENIKVFKVKNIKKDISGNNNLIMFTIKTDHAYIKTFAAFRVNNIL